MSDPQFTDHSSVHMLPSEADTLALAQQLAHRLKPGMVVTLSGDLGAGKTTLVRAVLRELGVTGAIKSPTYTLVEPYLIPLEIPLEPSLEPSLEPHHPKNSPHPTHVKVISDIYFYHFDFYRFVDPDEWLEAGFGEYFDGAAVALIEWPERAGDLLPQPDLQLTLTLPEPPASGRIATLQAHTEAGKTALKCLKPRTKKT